MWTTWFDWGEEKYKEYNEKLSGIKTILASTQTNISNNLRWLERFDWQMEQSAFTSTSPSKVQKETLREASPHFPPTTPSRRRPFPVPGSGPAEQSDR